MERSGDALSVVVQGRSTGWPPTPSSAWRPRSPIAHADRLTVPPDEHLIIHGALSTPDEGTPAGVVLAVQAPTAGAVRALLGGGLDKDVEIHGWEFGGRR